MFSLLIAGVIFFVRDGFAAILFSSFLMVVVGNYLKINKILIVVFTTFVASLFWVFFESIFEGSFIFVRSMGVAEQGSAIDFGAVTSPYGYFVRLLGNSTNLAFRPVLFDIEGNINILAVSYWISGITLLYAIFCCFRSVFSKNSRDANVGMVGIFIVLLISITPYVQPRYLFPLCLCIPMFSFTSPMHFIRSCRWIVLLSLLAAYGYSSMQNYPPAPEANRVYSEKLGL